MLPAEGFAPVEGLLLVAGLLPVVGEVVFGVAGLSDAGGTFACATGASLYDRL